ncbi:MAG: hypothetical protein H7Y31_17420 [Chitinophagaceae bacterium]|nr:hypothetical protein [Chitinophagaceae bacterium]
MTTLTRLICLCAMMCWLFPVGAQEYIIRHDFLKENSTYYKVSKNGDTVKLQKEGIKRKGNVTLVINNYNPFFWESKVEKTTPADEDGEDLSKIFNPLTLLKQMGGGMIDQFLPIGIGGGSRGSSKMSGMFNQYKNNYNEVSRLRQVMNEYIIAEQRLEELKYNTTDPAEEIKLKAVIIVATVAGTSQSQMDTARTKALQYDNRYSYLIYSLDTLYRSFNSYFSTADYAALDDDEKELWNNVVAELRNYYQPKVDALETRATGENKFSKEVERILLLYKEIKETRFEYRYQLTSNTDVSMLRVSSYPSATITNRKDTLTRFITVRRKNGMRLTNSFGISFAALNEKKYFIAPDSLISSSRANLFTPIVTSFVHFYGSRRNGIKWGGNIGVGIPLTTSEKGISFLSGLSAIFGRKDEMIVSIGAVGSKIAQLENGLKVGDKVQNPSNFNLPTESYYRVGAFVGFTFNISALTGSKK